jgi:hypothetical protein
VKPGRTGLVVTTLACGTRHLAHLAQSPDAADVSLSQANPAEAGPSMPPSRPGGPRQKGMS